LRRSSRSTSKAIILSLGLVGCVQPPEPPSSPADNRPPVVSGLTAEPSTIRVGAASTVTVTASDPEGGALRYRWRATTGDIIGEGPSIRFTASFCCTGTNFVEVTVLDPSGGSTVVTAEVLITY
jgi:hypothetical protein